MLIGFFFPDHSATSQILADLVFYLARSDIEIHVVTSRLSYDKSSSARPAFEKIDNVMIHRVWTSSFGRMNMLGRAIDYFSFYVSAVLKLLLLVRRDDILIAKTDPPLISVFTTLIAKLFGAKRINWVQDLFPEVAINLDVKILKGMLGRLLICLRNYSLNGASHNVVLGDRMRERLIQEGVNPTNIDIIHNWAPGNRSKIIAGNPLRSQWGLDGKFVVGYSGNLGRAHDSETIIKAMVTLKNHEQIVFLFIGGGSHFAKVEKACKDHGISNVLFKPYQPRELLNLSLSAADVHWLVLQPQLEGLIVPSKFYGAAASGRPIIFIGDADGELARLIYRHNMGFVVALGDYQTLVDKFCLLASNSLLCQQMGASSWEAFYGKFDKTIAFNAWQKVLSEVQVESTADIISNHEG